MPTPLLQATSIHKRFGRRLVLQDESLEAYPGEAVALVGENGAGKTTLLRICAGLIAPDAGRIAVGGTIGYSPQEPGLLDLLTADEHVVYFGRALGFGREESLARGRTLLAEFAFPDGRPTMARELSGVTRQKLNLVLALLGDPPLLLLDEPYQGFDRGTYVNFWDHVATWREQGKAIVVVTHMLAELARVDRVVELRVAA